jgi:hypothetical protein
MQETLEELKGMIVIAGLCIVPLVALCTFVWTVS